MCVTVAFNFSNSWTGVSSSCTGVLNSAGMQRQETGQREWICYVPTDVQQGAKAMEAMY